MKKGKYKIIACSLFLLMMLGCAAGKKQETAAPPEKDTAAAAQETTANTEMREAAQPRKDPVASRKTSKTRLIFDVASCSWSYIDENGTLQAVSIEGGKASYVSGGKAHSIDASKAELEFK